MSTASSPRLWIRALDGASRRFFADGALLSGRDGGLLWRVAVYRETDWTRPANDVIEGLTRKLARKFPYQT